MRILIDHGDYNFRNIGDSAMLCLTVERLTAIFPAAKVVVVAENAQSLRKLCPLAIPLAAESKRAWCGYPELAHKPWKFFRRQVKKRFSRIVGLQKQYPEELFAGELAAADLVVAAGGGYITAEFLPHALSVVQLLTAAKGLGRPVVMFGQGLGPVTDGELDQQLARILPHIDLLCLREGLISGELLHRYGVEEAKWLVTGDDALELGYRQRQADLGSHCGINLRRAPYAAAEPHLPAIYRAVVSFATEKCVPLEPLPISCHHWESDARTLADIFNTHLSDSSGGAAITTVDDLCRSISRCRVVVTGSYHAGVFALAQGIPVVALAGTPYYAAKFSGLADQFKGGIAIVSMAAEELEADLVRVLQEFWEQADRLRPLLLQAAAKQVNAGQLAYERVRNLVQRS